MQKHGRGPKRVLVRRYARWQKGFREYVAKHRRGLTPELSARPTPKQLDFGFPRSSGPT